MNHFKSICLVAFCSSLLLPDADLSYDVPSPVSSEASDGGSGAADTSCRKRLERGGGGGEESAGPSGTRDRGSRGRATERRESCIPVKLT